MFQRVVDQTGVVYDTLPVLAGPHDWKVGDVEFTTVVCKCPGDEKWMWSVIHTRSGKRVGRCLIRAPKTKPHTALQAVSKMIDELRAKVGDRRVAQTIKYAADLPAIN